MKKILTVSMAAILSLTMLTGCNTGGGGGENEVDNTKSQLYVGNLLSGYGETWINNLADAFEEYYKNTSLEEGKVGVQVHIDNRQAEFMQGPILANMKNYDNDVYYLDNISNQSSFVSAGLLTDTTAWVTEKIYDENGDIAADTGKAATQSIIDTMYDGWSEHFNFGTEAAPEYYGMPWRVSFGGIVYDADLFDLKRLYMLEDGTFDGNYQDLEDGLCSKGPDGVSGTSDDGLPNTWNDFVRLMDQMKAVKVTPFIWSSNLKYQRQIAFEYIVANYEGYDDFMLNFTFNGEDSELGEINGGNAWKLRSQQGKKAGLKAFYDIMKSGGYTASSFGSTSHKEAEKEYLQSITSNQPIAMLMEGGWWEQESREYADQLAATNLKWGYGMRNFKLLPIPKFTNTTGIANQTNTERVLYGTGASSLECVAAHTPRQEIAKKWIQFVHSRESLSSFTKDTSAFRPFNFEVTPEEFEGYTSFTKSIYTYIDEGAKLAYDLNISKVRRDNSGTFTNFITRFTAGNVDYFEPMIAFKNNPIWTVEDVFDVYTRSCYTEDTWTYTD